MRGVGGVFFSRWARTLASLSGGIARHCDAEGGSSRNYSESTIFICFKPWREFTAKVGQLSFCFSKELVPGY